LRPDKDRRKTPRHLCSDFAHISWLDDSQRTLSAQGLLEDPSPEGLCLSLDLPVPTGRPVHVHTKGFEGEAQVRYCGLGDYGYLVGLEFCDGCTWERDKWRPQHLYGRCLATIRMRGAAPPRSLSPAGFCSTVGVEQKTSCAKTVFIGSCCKRRGATPTASCSTGARAAHGRI